MEERISQAEIVRVWNRSKTRYRRRPSKPNSPRGVGIHDQGLVPLGEHDLQLGSAHERCRLDLLRGIGISSVGCFLECGGGGGGELVYSMRRDG